MISFYLRNKNINPSCYYRVVQYLDGFEEEYRIHSLTPDYIYNISINSGNGFIRLIAKTVMYIQMSLRCFFYMVKDFKSADIIFVQRETVPRCIPFFLKKLIAKLYSSKPVIWDIDDNLWERHEISNFESDLLLKYADRILISAPNIKKLIEKAETRDISIIPTTDGSVYSLFSEKTVEERIETLNKEIRLIWLGTTGNEKELKKILPYLEKTAEKLRKPLILTLVSGREPDFLSNKLVIRFVKWSRETAAYELLHNHIGIMPLEDTAFNQSKGGFKLLQYMSAGLPVIADPIGINRDIVIDENGYCPVDCCGWIEAVNRISADAEKYRELVYGSYEFWIKYYSYEKIQKRIHYILKKDFLLDLKSKN